MAQISTINGTSGNDILDLSRGDAFQSGELVAMVSSSWADGQPAIAQLLVNGQVVAQATVWATAQSGASQELSYVIPAGTAVTSVGIAYVNDLFRSTTEDRNLFLNSFSLNGVRLQLNQGTYTPEAHPVQAGERLMAWNGPLVFSGAVVSNAMAADTYTRSLTVDGAAGYDTAMYVGRFTDYTVGFANGNITFNSKTQGFGPDTLRSVERVLIDDVGGWGSGGAASIVLDGNNRTINGGWGIDTVVYNGSRADYTIERTSAGNHVVTHVGGPDADVLLNVERISFSDANLALDVSGNGGMAYRLYQAAFNRAPDIGGLGFQMSALDNGLPYFQVADNFLRSPEFQNTYGNLSNEAYVRLLYQNVLHREGEAAGVAFHTNNLNTGATLRYHTLAQFSESPENQANLIGTIEDGMVYTL